MGGEKGSEGFGDGKIINGGENNGFKAGSCLEVPILGCFEGK